MSFSFRDRSQALSLLASNSFDLAIIGGGAVGCSTAAYAAGLGLHVLLVERDDFASGTSGHSTGLAHAGLRYLAQGRVAYVWHETQERARLQEIAPHYVRPFDFLFPVYEKDPFGLRLIRIGTALYDGMGWLFARWTGRRPSRCHRVLSPEEVLRRVPGLDPRGLQGAAEYFVDARLIDTRFTLGFAQLAAERGAQIVTHARVTSIDLGDRSATLTISDALGSGSYVTRARLVLNAAGPWIDDVRLMAGQKKRIVRTSRGIHLLVDRIAEVPLIASMPVKGRVFFVLPFGSDASLIGTTDTPTDGSPDQQQPDPAEIQDLIQQLLRLFPKLSPGSASIERIRTYYAEHVRQLYWGVRPLLWQQGSTVTASREHALVKDDERFWSFPGVKLTAARAAGEEAALAAYRHLRGDPSAPMTSFRLPGGEFDDELEAIARLQQDAPIGELTQETWSYLFQMYGMRTEKVLAFAIRDQSLAKRILAAEPWIWAEVHYLVEEEMVLSLNDLLWRRTRWAMLRFLPAQTVQAVAARLGDELGWDAIRLEHELAQYQEVLRRRTPVAGLLG